VSFFGVIRVFRGPLALRRGSSKSRSKRRKNAWTFVLLILIIRVIRGFKNRKMVLTYFTAFR
jgi:hypothetical protein